MKVDKLVNLLGPLFPHLQSRSNGSVLPQEASRGINEMKRAKRLASAASHSVLSGDTWGVFAFSGKGGLRAGLTEEEMPACTLGGNGCYPGGKERRILHEQSSRVPEPSLLRLIS